MASAASKQARRPAPANFLEALRELRTDAASVAKVQITKAVTEDLPQALGLSSSGDLKPNQTFSLEDLRRAEDRGERRAEARLGNQLQQERFVYLKSENETKSQIKSLLSEIQSLAKSAGGMARQVEIAAIQAPVNPGVYHKNFFEQLRSFIIAIRRRVDASRHWLAVANTRAAKKSFYWSQAKTSGTKFTLSQERYMVTTTGYATMPTPIHLQPLLDLLRIPSVSPQPDHGADMAACRRYLTGLFHSLGFKTQLLPSSVHPAVFANSSPLNIHLPTVLIYGHYDVQPADPLDMWSTPPFEPTIKNHVLYGRGSTDNKGQFMTHVAAIRTLLDQSGSLPVNIKFLLEGEEEIGSPGISQIVRKYSSLLKADYLVVSDSDMPAPNQPVLEISLRGLVEIELTLRTAHQDIHSGQFGGVAPNPAILMAQLISTLKNPAGRVLIPGFYDSVVPPSAKDPADFQKTGPDPATLRKEGGFFYIGGGEENFSLNQRRWFRPTLDVCGLTAGYTGPGIKTIIPSHATAKITMRLVPNQNPDAVLASFCSFVKSQIPPLAKLEIVSGPYCLPFKTAAAHSVFSLAKDCLKKAFGSPAVFSASGGSIGAVPVLVNALGRLPCLMIALGNSDDNLHAPNEHFSLSNFEKGTAALVDFYAKLPKIKPA